jgi:hypothetical protein
VCELYANWDDVDCAIGPLFEKLTVISVSFNSHGPPALGVLRQLLAGVQRAADRLASQILDARPLQRFIRQMKQPAEFWRPATAAMAPVGAGG